MGSYCSCEGCRAQFPVQIKFSPIEESFQNANLNKIKTRSSLNKNYESNTFEINNKIPKNAEDFQITDSLFSKFKKVLKPLNDGIDVEEMTQIYSDGQYRGEYNPKNYQKHGRGIYLWNYNMIYLGYWQNDLMNKKGRKISAVEIEDLKGIDLFSDELKLAYYDGRWKDGVQDGKGIEQWPDGVRYEGEYSNGKKEGMGLLISPGYFIYEGHFEGDEINGKGKIIYSDGREYEGDWVKNKKEGIGIYKWPDGRIYEGHYKNDKKDGEGKLIFPDGKVYKGWWTKGLQNDEGIIIYPNKGKIIKGKWKNGLIVKYDV